MPKTIIESVLCGKLALDIVLKWLNTDSDEETPEDCELFCCSRSEFVAYFIAFLRIQTDGILKPKSSAIQNKTPESKFTPRSHKRSTSEPTSQQETETPLKTERHRSHESPNRDKNQTNYIKKPGRRVKTKLFMSESKEFTNQSFSTSKTDSDDSKLSSNSSEYAVSSTPLKNGVKVTDYPNLNVTSPVTPQGSGRQSFSYERCDTPRIGNRYKSLDKSVSFGDYMVNAHIAKTSAQKKKRQSKNVSIETDGKSLDLSSSEMFPTIGATKSTDKKRIKPTNIDRVTPKSFTMNSFNADQFEQPSSMVLEDNLAFRHQKMQPKELAKSFEVERNILKQERHKLMEKFNILNVGTAPKSSTSQIKITQKISTEQNQSFVKADLNKVVFKNEIDKLTNIYNVMINNNLVLSVGCEILFLISILLSKQSEDDFKQIEQLMTAEQNLTSNIEKYVLKTIHNSIYFAIKSLWNLRQILEVVFDRSTLKLLGDNKDVRGFLPDLAKFLLNAYGLKCEQDNAMLQSREEKETTILDSRTANGMVCFNVETDNVENFPSVLSFQNFRKQRDMFYEILRWYNETQQTGAAKSTFRSRVKTIFSLCVCAANYAHLARLYVAHMVAECLSNRREDSKLSKLQRRLTGATIESYRLPFFTETEMFYKEFLLFAEQESFRAHLKDCLSSEICALDSTALANIDESSPDIAKEYMHTAKKLQLLSKFLGFLIDLPYTQVPIDYNLKTGHSDYSQRDITYSMPKEKVLLNEISMRNYNQPLINLKGILTDATEKERLCLTLPWIIQYLASLHYASLRINYYKELINILFAIYTECLRENSRKSIKKNIKILLKFQLGWLFDLPQFPQELFYEKNINKMATGSESLTDDSDVLRLDSVLCIDESMILELCPFLRDVSSLLSSTRPIVDNKDCSYRHITPLSLTLNSDEKIRNKEREIQLRLEEALVKSSPASTRRVLELVIERVSASTLRALTTLLRDARDDRSNMLRLHAASLSTTDLHSTLTQLYTAKLESLKKEGLGVAQKRISCGVKSALGALLTLSPKQAQPLEAIAIRHCKENVAKWIRNNWTGIDVLCKDINEEVRNIATLGASYINNAGHSMGPDRTALLADGDRFEEANIAPSLTVIKLKEYICILLDNERSTMDIYKVLSDCLSVCSPTNVFTLPGLHGVVCQLVCDLCVVLASRNPKQINEIFLQKIYEIFNICCPDRQKTESTHKSTDKSEDLDNIADVSVDQINCQYMTELSMDNCDIERDFSQDDRLPTPITDEDEENSSKTVLNNDIKNKKTLNTDPSKHKPSNSKAITKEIECLNANNDNEIVFRENVVNIDEIKSKLTSLPSIYVVDNLDIQNSNLVTEVSVLDTDSNLPKILTEKDNIKSNIVDKKPNTGIDFTDFDTKKEDTVSKITVFDTKNPDMIEHHTKTTNPDIIKSEKIAKITDSNAKTPDARSNITKITNSSGNIVISNSITTEVNTKSSESDSKRIFNDSTKIEDAESSLDYFNRILCSRNVVILSSSPHKSSDVWEAMAELLLFLLKYAFLNEESLTEQCLAVYRQDWPQNVLENLSTCMKIVSTKWRTRLGGKFNLFLDFLSEYCNTMEFDSFEFN